MTSLLHCLVALALFTGPGCRELAEPKPAVRTVAPCTWSYFGDPRAVALDSTVVTGCVAPDGAPVVEAFDLESDRRRVTRPFGRLEPDDHNNPSLVAFRGRLYAFSSPHSGYQWPLDRASRMRYRSTRDPFAAGGGWGATRTVPLGQGCGLGYTYPNPVVAGDRLYLFMRGPCWSPYVTWTDDGIHWSRSRTLVRAPQGPTARKVRPYAKYAPGPDGSILMLFSDGHPASWKASLYFARFADGRFHSAAGEELASLADGPPRVRDLERIHAYSPGGGRAWPMDVAWHPDGFPVAVYTTLDDSDRDTFRYARWELGRWAANPIARAGEDLFGYHNQGATLDHADPDRVVLSRTVAGQNEVEERVTPDGGRSWAVRPVTRGSREFNVRPVIPRGLPAEHEGTLLWVAGTAEDYRDYDTTVKMRRE